MRVNNLPLIPKFFLSILIKLFILGFTYKNWLEKQSFKLLGKPLLYVIFIFGYVWDVITNYILSGYFKDKPKTWDETVTWRMMRYKKLPPEDYKHRFAIELCELANQYDENHC